MTTRQEIIKTYRQRIEEGKRSKLSKQERAELIEWFIIDMKNCETELQCQQRCHAELQLLEEGYPVKSIAAQYLPQWRKAIEGAVADGNLPTMELEPTKHGIIYPHWALVHLRYSNEIYQAINEAVARANNKRQDDLKPIRPDRFIQTARELLDSEDFRDVAVGLLALTGRRFSEIIAKGKFAPTTHLYALQFTGQLKKKLEPETFTIATIFEAEKILKAIDKLHSHPRIQELQELGPDTINSRINTSIRSRIKLHFEDSGLVPLLTGEKSVSAHNLRGIYAAIAIHFFCPENQATHRFIQAHLGHVIGESELERRKNSGATEHYFHYYLIGAQGQHLAAKGILLNTLPPLSEATLLDVTVTDTELTPAIAPARSPNPQSPTVLDPAPPPALTPDPAIATLAQTLTWLQQKLDEAHAEIRQLRALSPSQSTGELAQLQEENQRLQAENDQLRADLQQFHQLKKIMGVPEAENGHPPESPPSEDSGENNRGPQPITLPDSVQNQGAFASPTPTNTLPNTHENRAISAIIAYNNQPGLSHDQKWFISIPSLMDLIRGYGNSTSQKPLRAAMDARQDEITHHHQQHNLGVRHNVKHGKANREIQNFIKLRR